MTLFKQRFLTGLFLILTLGLFLPGQAQIIGPGGSDGCAECRLTAPTPSIVNLGNCRYGFVASGASSRCPYLPTVWNYGDGSPTTTGAFGLHTYTSPGVYTVCVTFSVQGLTGICSITNCITITVPNCSESCVNCVITPGTMTVQQPTPCLARVTMGGSSSACPLVEFRYNFGDGTTSVSTSPFAQHTYSASGTYTICVTEVRSNGTDICTYTYCQTITVTGCLDPCDACPITPGTMTTQFGAPCWLQTWVSGSSSPCPLDHWEFNYGDGSPVVSSLSPFGSHTYAASGTYTVCITEVRSNGTVSCKRQYCRQVTVVGCPAKAANFDGIEDWKIYPTMLAAGSHVQYELPSGLGNVTLSLMDATGREVQGYEVVAGKGSFKLPETVAPGMYFVRTNQASLATLRLIVQ